MNRLLISVVFFSLVVIIASCSPDETDQLDIQLNEVLAEANALHGGEGFQLPQSFDYASIPQDPANPITIAKVLLGQQLYHETGLATNPLNPEGEGTYSCASCHFASAGFQAGRFQGIGEGGTGIGGNGSDRQKKAAYTSIELDVQPIRTPTTLNVAYQELMLWNGAFGSTGMNVGTEVEWRRGTPAENNLLGYEGVETQAIAGLDVHRLEIDPTWLQEVGYTALFDDAFPDREPAERYNAETAGLAIAAYERTLLPNEAPFQKYLQGNHSALSEIEKRGALLFFGEANCVSCHNGPALNSMSFHVLAMGDLDECPEEVFETDEHSPANLGRGSFTKKVADYHQFKTPSLYNLADSPFYGHGASFRAIEEVVAYKNEAIPQNSRVPESFISPQFQPLRLSAQEVDDITAFLTYSLYDSNLKRYEPDALLSGLCFPNNDEQSRIDLDCN